MLQCQSLVNLKYRLFQIFCNNKVVGFKFYMKGSFKALLNILSLFIAIHTKSLNILENFIDQNISPSYFVLYSSAKWLRHVIIFSLNSELSVNIRVSFANSLIAFDKFLFREFIDS